jgi:hypothetical protein
MKLPAIVAALAANHQEDAFDDEIKLYRSDLSDRPSSGLPPLEDIGARILRALEAELWPSVQTIAEFLNIPTSTVHLHLTTSLNMKSRHFR